MNRKRISYILVALLSLYVIGVIAYIWHNPDRFQWDFGIYYDAAKAFSQGQNPYNQSVLLQMGHSNNVDLKFMYPPVVLLVFRPLVALDYESASHLFLLFKLLLLLFLVILWSKVFLKQNISFFFLLFCLLGFNSAVFIDLAAGNISIIEQSIIWLAFYFFMGKKYIRFSALIILVALFKVVPILFLFLFLIVNHEKKYLYLLCSTMVFFAVMLLSYAINPSLFLGFANNSGIIDVGGIINPSNLSFFVDIFKFIKLHSGVEAPIWIPIFLYLVITLSILLISIKGFRKIINADIERRNLIIIFMGCVVYTLILPRFKDYSFILLLVPTYYIISRDEKIKLFPMLYAIAILASTSTLFYWPGLDVIIMTFWKYYSLILAYIIWYLYLRYVKMETRPQLGELY